MRERNISVNLVRALELARDGRRIFGIVGPGRRLHARRSPTACVVIPPLYDEHITPHTEGLCAVVWHLLVSHPRLQLQSTKWESMR